MKQNNRQDKLKRLKAANEFIKVIAGCGRRFFKHKNYISSLELSDQSRVFFNDYYSKKRIYTHKSGRWDGFTSGGTLKSLVESMRDFITKGDTMRAGYFQPKMDNGFRNPWGYGDDILIVKEAAIRLGLAKEE